MEKSVERHAAASDSHAALRAAAINSPPLAAKTATNHIQNRCKSFIQIAHMKNKFLIITLVIFLISCSKNDENDDQSQIDCDRLKAALVNFNSEQLNFEVNKLTEDLLPSPTQDDEIGHFINMNTLVTRLNDNCPQIRATKECYACIESIPLQSEIKVELDSSGIQIVRLIDISTPSDGILISLRSHTSSFH